MNNNPFRDVNPYEAPIVAELNEPRVYRQPRPAKRRPPVFSLLWTLCGPFIWVYGMKYIGVEMLDAFGPDDHAVIWFLLGVGGLIWLTTAIRSLIWLIRFAFS